MEARAALPQSSGKVMNIKCRKCLKSMLLQNYSTHLKMKHPNENFKDLRGKEDQDISNMFKRKRENDDTIGRKKTKLSVIDDQQNSKLLAEAAATPLPLDTGLISDNDVSGDENTGKGEVNNNLEGFNNLLSKLAPLASIDDSTILKLAENLEALSKIDINKKPDKDTIECKDKGDPSGPADKRSDMSGLLFSCKTVQDVTSKFQEFDYNEDKEAMVCCVCSIGEQKPLNFSGSGMGTGVFKYKTVESLSKTQSLEFRHLKNHLKAHLSSNLHKESLQVLTNKVNPENKEDSRNQAVALRLGRICYFLLKHGRPDTDFLSMIYLHSVNGSDFRDINHSNNFPGKFLPHVTKVVTGLLKLQLSTRMVQTGKLPVVNVTADKATWKHETRQGVGIVQVVPDSEKVLQGFVLGFPETSL